MFALSLSPVPLFLDTIPGIDPGPYDPGSLPGDDPSEAPEPDFDPEPEPDPDPLGPTTDAPGIDPGFPAPSIPGGPSPILT